MTRTQRSPPSPDRIAVGDLPQRFGRYELLALLGEGGMGRVFRARLDGPEGFRKVLAIKVVRERVAEQEGVRAAIVREARIGGSLTHPHLIDIYDFGLVEGQPFIAMECVEGESLAERLTRGPLGPDELLDLLLALLRGLSHLHGLVLDGEPAGLVHRDLKPGNVLLGRDGRIKITDYGLARAVEGPDALTWSDAVRGTPAYMSPEQARGRVLSPRSDLFAWGLIAFEAASGERLLRGGSVFEVMAHLMRVEDRQPEVRALDRVWPGLGALVASCLHDDPEARPASVEVVLGELVRLRTRGPSAALAAALTVPAPSSRRRPGSSLVELGGSFFGRGAELAEIARHFGEGARLVCLIGAGGSGKTRLARRAAAQDPGESVVFVDLTTASSLDGVCLGLAQGLGIPLPARDSAAALGEALAGHGPLLVVLDNFEQIAAWSSETVSRWLRDAPQVRLLVTSRAVLRVVGERVVRVGPLPGLAVAPRRPDGAPDLAAAEEAPAVALFVARAQEASPAFALRDDNVADVVALVEALEGIPLAIELAAARVRVLSPARILQHLPRRFELLTTGRTDLTGRQATLRATVDWSWGLLEPWERPALAQLSVFVGGLSIESAEAMLDLSLWPGAPWAVDVVHSLVDKSLLRASEPDGLPGETRFTPYETIREYAAEKLADPGAMVGPLGEQASGPAARRRAEERHGAWAAGFRAGLTEPATLAGVGRTRRLELLELDNLIAAADRAAARDDVATLEGAGGHALEVLGRGGPYGLLIEAATRWRERLIPGPAQRRFDLRRARALRITGQSDRALEALDAAVQAAEDQGDAALLEALLQRAPAGHNVISGGAGRDAGRALELARTLGDRRAEATALDTLGVHASRCGRPEESRQHLEASLRLFRLVKDPEGEVQSLINLSTAYKELSLDMLLEGSLQEALRRAREIGFHRAEANALLNLGVRWQETGRLTQAEQAYRESLALLRRMGDGQTIPICLGNLGDVQRELGDLSRAEEHLREALHRMGGVGEPRTRWGTLAILADILRDAGRLDEALDAAQRSLAALELSRGRRFWLDGQRRLGSILLGRGELEAAGEALQLARAGVAEGLHAGGEARIFAMSAEWARRTGDLAQCEAWLDHAEECARACDDRLHLGMIAVRRSRLAADRGDAVARARALGQALATADDLNLPPAAELRRAIAAAG